MDKCGFHMECVKHFKNQNGVFRVTCALFEMIGSLVLQYNAHFQAHLLVQAFSNAFLSNFSLM